MPSWTVDNTLSNLAARVAEKHGTAWERVVCYVERIVEGEEDPKMAQRAYGGKAAALGKEVEELDDLEKRMGVLEWLLKGGK